MTYKSTNTIKDRARPTALAALAGLAALMVCSCAPGPRPDAGFPRVSVLRDRSTPTKPAPLDVVDITVTLGGEVVPPGGASSSDFSTPGSEPGEAVDPPDGEPGEAVDNPANAPDDPVDNAANAPDDPVDNAANAPDDPVDRRLSANPLFWVDKRVALETAFIDGTVLEMNRAYANAEIADAKVKIATFIVEGKITQAEVDQEIAFQKGQDT